MSGIKRALAYGCLSLFACAGAHGKCQVEQQPQEVDMGRMLVQQATDAAVSARLAESVARFSVTCPKGTKFRFRGATAAKGGTPVAGDEANLTSAGGNTLARVAVVLVSFDAQKIEKRFSTFPGGVYPAVGTGAPQMVVLKLALAQRQGGAKKLNAALGSYKLAMQFELEED